MVQQLKTALESATSYAELAAIVDEAREEVTFFGHRYVYLDSYEGTLPLDSLALRVMGLLAEKKGLFQDQQEREVFDEIVDKINVIFEHNFARTNNLITSIFCFTRDFWATTELTSYNTYFYWENKFMPPRQDYSNHSLALKFFSKMTHEIQPVWPDISSFSELLPLCETAREDISFFGYRYIHFLDYSGDLPINALANRTMEIAKSTLDFTQDEDYQKIIPFIDRKYLNNEITFEKKGFFTRTFCAIRDSWNQNERERQSRAAWEQFKDDSAQMSG